MHFKSKQTDFKNVFCFLLLPLNFVDLIRELMVREREKDSHFPVLKLINYEKKYACVFCSHFAQLKKEKEKEK